MTWARAGAWEDNPAQAPRTVGATQVQLIYYHVLLGSAVTVATSNLMPCGLEETRVTANVHDSSIAKIMYDWILFPERLCHTH